MRARIRRIGRRWQYQRMHRAFLRDWKAQKRLRDWSQRPERLADLSRPLLHETTGERP